MRTIRLLAAFLAGATVGLILLILGIACATALVSAALSPAATQGAAAR